ncbi:carbohydrate-binding module family 18 protein [Paramyrothecium foliicola]|nr:carbohydrate-binding module family 18 protein [Paramyrothecium foliicola]
MRVLPLLFLARYALGKVAFDYDKAAEGGIDILRREEEVTDTLLSEAEFKEANGNFGQLINGSATVETQDMACVPVVMGVVPSTAYAARVAAVILEKGAAEATAVIPLVVNAAAMAAIANRAIIATFETDVFTTTYSITTTRVRYYYWTVTYWYWYYYWTYSVRIEASVVTSSRSTTSTIFSVETTDAGAASRYFEDLSETIALPTPAEATQLESLAGRTSYIEEPTTSTSSTLPEETLAVTSRTALGLDSSSSDNPDFPSLEVPQSTSNEEEEQSTTSSESRAESSENAGISPPDPPSSPDSGARALWANLDVLTVVFCSLSIAIGVSSVLL